VVEKRPYSFLKRSIAEVVSDALNSECNSEVQPSELELLLEEPRRKEFGDLSFPLPRLRQYCKKGMDELWRIVERALSGHYLIKQVTRVGTYSNIHVDMSRYAFLFFESLKALKEQYGKPFSSRKERIVVEYVSANPVHPLHIGSGRNAVIGDFIYRILKEAGNEVERRYYIDDVGLQVAYLAYGYMKLGRPHPPPNMKPDHYYGLIYAATATIVDILKLKKLRAEAKNSGDLDKYAQLGDRIHRLMADLTRLKERIPNEVDRLMDELSKEPDPEASISKLMRGYELGLESSTPVREVAQKVIEGIRQTLATLGIEMDRWDWESDLIREGLVDEVLSKAYSSPYFGEHKGLPALVFSELLKDEEIRAKLRIPKGLEIPPLILRRSDGSTLYTTRDIAYTLKKFREFKADRVINVIAVEQTLPQAQLRLALYALGYRKEAESLYHYSYEMVNLPGMSMSGRRGAYVTVDDVINMMTDVVMGFMKERGEPDRSLALKIARSAFKYMMLSTSPSKMLVFDVEKALDRKQLSGPYLQYSFARAKSVLRKAGGEVPWELIDYGEADAGLRKELVWLLSQYPSVVQKVLEELQPEDLVTHLNKVSDVFNRWYDSEPIAKEAKAGTRALKLAITYGVSVVLENGMRILGMDILPRV
jgi:arginyl-tRNA synthetase